MSLRLRVAALVVGAFSAVLLVVGAVIPNQVRTYLTDRLDEQLDDAGFIVGGLLLADRPGFEPRGPSVTFAGAYVESRSASGEVIEARFVDPDASADLSAPELPDVIDRSVIGTPFTVASLGGDEVNWRVLVVERPAPPSGDPGAGAFGTAPEGGGSAGELEFGLATIALPTTSIDATVSQIVRIEWIVGGASVLALALVSWFLVGFGLEPLRRMERSAATISTADHLDQRVEHPSPRTELGRLGSTLNQMLGRLQHSFEGQQLTEARLRRFAADASHELRTPLTSIRGYAELYRRGGDQPEQVGRSMDRIEQEAVRMSRLVDDLLALARLDERVPIEPEAVDLRPIVDDLAADLRVVDPARPVTVVGPDRFVVEIDGFRVTQALANLLTNARVHTPAGTPVEIRLEAGAEWAQIAVVDHGPGLPEEAAGQVFERFYRADPSRSRAQGGAGLGLAITAAIVEAHGGTVGVTPTSGGGATFVVRLPAAELSRS